MTERACDAVLWCCLGGDCDGTEPCRDLCDRREQGVNR